MVQQKLLYFLNLVGFNIEMLYTETDKGDLVKKDYLQELFYTMSKTLEDCFCSQRKSPNS